MLRSMTGFGRAEGDVEGVHYAVEIRSVNNRYFKLATKLPDGWLSAEPEIEKHIRRRLARGSVTVSVRMRIPDERAAHRVNGPVLQNYLQQVHMLEMEGDPILRVDLANMMQLPGVCEPPAMEQIAAETHDGLMALLEEALDALGQMRCSEGEALREDLMSQCGAIEGQLASVRERVGVVVQEYYHRLQDRVQELVRDARVQIDAETLAREVAIFAERSDVSEEVNRLSTHLEQFRKALDSTEPAGRKLDFIAQEMLREANTIGSKSNDAEIARAVLEIKTAVDRIKEQAANAE